MSNDLDKEWEEFNNKDRHDFIVEHFWMEGDTEQEKKDWKEGLDFCFGWGCDWINTFIVDQGHMVGEAIYRICKRLSQVELEKKQLAKDVKTWFEIASRVTLETNLETHNLRMAALREAHRRQVYYCECENPVNLSWNEEFQRYECPHCYMNEIKSHRAKALETLKAIRGWDQLDSTADGTYFKRLIDDALLEIEGKKP